MSKPKTGSEEALELETIQLFQSLGYSHQNCLGEWDSGKSNLDRQTRKDVILTQKLKTALTQLNPDQSTEVINLAIEELTKDRSAQSLANANREIYHLLKKGVKVQTRDEDGNPDDQTIKIIDWQTPENNHFFLASQMKIAGETYRRIPDLLGFVNGIPLVFIELKAHTEPVQKAYDDNAQTRNAEAFLNQLLQLVDELNIEDQRAIALNLDEEKLALFDLLIDPDIELTDQDKTTIKKGAEELLTILKREKLVLDWRKRQQTRSLVKVAIKKVLDKNLPESYTPERFDKKCEQVYQHIYESYADAQNNIYRQAA